MITSRLIIISLTILMIAPSLFSNVKADDEHVEVREVNSELASYIENVGSTSDEPVNLSRGWWYSRQVDSGNEHNSMALDSNGYPHVVYQNGKYGDDNVKYAYWNGSAYHTEFIDPTIDSANNMDIEVDSRDRPHVLYLNYSNKRLTYAYLNDTGWHKQKILYLPHGVYHFDMALDPSDDPAILAYDTVNRTISLIKWNGTAWNYSLIKNGGGGHPMIKYDSSGVPHISFVVFGINYGYWNGTAWNMTKLYNRTGVASAIDMALNTSGSANFIHYDSTLGGVYLILYNGTGWNEILVDSYDDYRPQVSLTFDHEDNVHMVYYTYQDRFLNYSAYDGSSFIFQTLDTYCVDPTPDLETSGEGTIMMSLIPGSYLEVARLNFEEIEITTPVTGEKWERGRTHRINWTISYFESSATFRIDLFKEDGKVLTIAEGVSVSSGHYNWTVPSDLETGWTYRINVTYEDQDHISAIGQYFGIFPKKGWFNDKVTSDYYYMAWPTKQAIALNSSCVPYISGYYRSNTETKLFLSHQNDGRWYFEDVDANDDAGHYGSSLAFNSSDVAYVSYFTGIGYDLKFAVKNGTSWDISTIESVGQVGQRNQLRIDDNDNISIVFNDYTNTCLKFGRWNGKQWDISTILSGWDPYFSYVLDNDGTPHVFYSDRYNIYDLHYNGTGWVTDVIYSVMGHYTVQMFEMDACYDSEGSLHLVYCNNSGRSYLEYLRINATDTSHDILQKIPDVSCGLSPCIVIGSDDEVSITYVNYDSVSGDNYLNYGFTEDRNWTLWSLMEDRVSAPALTLDENDRPHLAYSVSGSIYHMRYSTLVSRPTAPSEVLDPDHELRSGHVSISWSPPADDGGMSITGYSIYRGNSSENMTLLANVTADKLDYLDETTVPMETYVYGILAFNGLGEGNLSASINVTVDVPVLLVDDDLWYTYDTHFKDALDASGIQYRTYNIYGQGSSPTLSHLSLFDCVIWTTGADSLYTLSADDQSNLMSYLDSGGKMFLSSQELLFDIGGEADGAITNPFINNYLKIGSVDNDVPYTSVSGVDGDVIATSFTSLPLSSPYTLYGDEYTIYSNGTTIFTNPSSGNTAGHRVDNDTYRIVFLSFPFEAVNNHDEDNGTSLMSKVVDWLLNDPGTPSPPADLTSQAGSGFVQLDWSYPLDNGSSPLSGFKLFRKDPSTGTVTQVSLSSTTIFYNDTSVSNDKYYLYSLKAYNSYGDSGSSREVISDDISPVLSDDTTPSAGYTGNELTFSVKAADNVKVKEVLVEYWFGDKAHTTTTLAGQSPYSLKITLPGDSTLKLHYVFKVQDTALNVVESIKRTVSVVDDDRPTFVSDSSDTSGTTGDLFTFQVDVVDNIGVFDTRVEFWYGSGTHRNLSFVSTKLITIPSNSTETLHYLFSCVDSAGNWNSTVVKDLTVKDNDLPTFGPDMSSVTATTGNPIELNISATDNVGIGSVWAEYWYGTSSHVNASMHGTGPYNLTLIAPEGSTDPFSYRFHASDPGGNWIETGTSTITITDDDRPTFSSDTTPSTATTGDPFTLEITASDNIDLYDVTAEYWYGYGPHYNLSMSGSGTYTMTITAPLDSITPLSYKFHAVDGEGNWADTPIGTVRILDNDLPSYFNDATPSSAGTGNTVNFSVRASDNVGVKQVRLLYYQGSQEGIMNITVPGDDHHNTTLMASWNDTSDLYYRFQVEDTSGNWWMLSNFKAISISDDDAPQLIADLTPRIAGTGDILSFIVQAVDNIAIGSMEVEYWYGAGPHSTLPMSGGPYLADLTVREDALDPIHYKIRIRDTSSNELQTDEATITIFDDDAPTISISAATPVNTGDTVNITAAVEDNIEVRSVWLEYRFGDGSPVNRSMSHYEGLYHLDIEIPIDMTDDLIIRVSASDGSGNMLTTAPYVLRITDNVPPWLIGDLSDRNATTGDEFLFEVEVLDNIGVRSVYVEYSVGGIGTDRVYLSGDATYSGTIVIGEDSAVELQYRVYFEDISGNLNYSGSVMVSITDNDPPVIIDNYSDGEAYTGDDFEFSVVAGDNHGISLVTVYYELLDWNGTIVLDGDGSYHASMTMPEGMVGTFEYMIEVEDINGHTIRRSYSVEVVDNDPPELLSVSYSGSLRSNSDIQVRVNITDNIGLVKTEIFYKYGGHAGDKALLPDDGSFRASFPVGDFMGFLDLRLVAEDGSGNVLDIDLPPVDIADGIPPTLEGIADITVTGQEVFNVTISAHDNSGMVSVEWIDLPFDGDGMFITGSIKEEGTYPIVVVVTDPNGNSANVIFSIIVVPAAVVDRDCDGMPDVWEEDNGLDPDDPGDAEGDPDGDGITNLEEYLVGWDPNASDKSSSSTEGGVPFIVMIMVILALVAVVVFLFIRSRPSGEEIPVGTDEEIAAEDEGPTEDGVAEGEDVLSEAELPELEEISDKI